MSEKEPEETEQETYHEIVRLIKEKDKKIETLETEMKEMKEMMKKNAEQKAEQEARIMGYCANCHHGLTAVETRQRTCPYCGAGYAYTSSPYGHETSP